MSKDILGEVLDLSHSLQVWQRLGSRFSMASLARALDLKRMLTNTTMGTYHTMNSSSQSIKTIADA